MEENINMIINMLKAEKTLLMTKYEKNKAEIWKCDLLIKYYLDLKSNLIVNLNKKRNSLAEYNSIINMLDNIPNTVLDIFKSFISENGFIEKALDIEEEILEIQEKNSKIDSKLIQIKKRKKRLNEKNERINKKILFIDEQLGKPIELVDESCIRKKLSHKQPKNKK